ncbi:MAG: transposase [Anaerolineaceae bacterium]|nr:transposase [Anaerolineaceae bacterium]
MENAIEQRRKNDHNMVTGVITKVHRYQFGWLCCMPNHFHGIIHILESGTDLRVCPDDSTLQSGAHSGAPLREVLLSRVMQWFKTMTTNEYIRNVRENGWFPFYGKLWQRSFYDRFIRYEDGLNRAREYIMDNPLIWDLDNENPPTDIR